MTAEFIPPDSQEWHGRRWKEDERDRRYMARADPRQARGVEYRYWHRLCDPELYDQGATSRCTAFAAARCVTRAPIINKRPDWDWIYDWSRRNDEWSGEDYEGTSVRASFKALRELGLITGFGWAMDAYQARDWILTNGPMVFGTEWFDGMDDVDWDGFVNLTGRGGSGHAYCVYGVDAARNFYCDQSWGEWGRGTFRKHVWKPTGTFKLRFEDADRLIKDMGEACTPMEVKK